MISNFSSQCKVQQCKTALGTKFTQKHFSHDLNPIHLLPTSLCNDEPAQGDQKERCLSQTFNSLFSKSSC